VRPFYETGTCHGNLCFGDNAGRRPGSADPAAVRAAAEYHVEAVLDPLIAVSAVSVADVYARIKPIERELDGVYVDGV
jgi:hypothetical protein